jgi:hypothetical protein
VQSRIQLRKFGELIARSFSLDAETGAKYANLIGDTPEIKDGQLLVRERDGTIIARLLASRIFVADFP